MRSEYLFLSTMGPDYLMGSRQSYLPRLNTLCDL